MRYEPLTQPQTAGTTDWTKQLVSDRRRSVERALTPAVEDYAARACAVLAALFHDAVTQANEALTALGLDDRLIVADRADGFSVTLDGDSQRHDIVVHTALRQIGRDLSGGAQVSTSATRAMIGLVAAPTLTGPRWVAPAAGEEFTAAQVGDLLLSVFGNDGAAMMRLLPYFSLGDGR